MKRIILAIAFAVFASYVFPQGALPADSILAVANQKLGYKDYLGSIREYNRVIRMQPKNIVANQNRAFAKFQVGDQDGALTDAQATIKIDPKNRQAHFILGEVLSGQQKYDRALKEYQTVLKAEPGNLEAFRGEVFCTYFMGNEKEAFNMVDNAIEKDKSQSMYFYVRGVLNNSREKYSRALDDLNKALDLNPGDNAFNVYLNRGVAYIGVEENDHARDDLTKAIELQPDNASAYHSRGRLYYNMKQYDDAVKDFTRSIELNPNNDVTYYNLGMAYYRLEDFKNACENFRKSCSMGNQNACKMVVMNCTGPITGK